MLVSQTVPESDKTVIFQETKTNPDAQKEDRMSKPMIFVCIAVVCYAIQNNVMEQKLATYNPAMIITVAYLAMLPLALARLGQLKLAGETLVLPQGAVLGFMLLAGVLWFFGDYLYASAFTSGGDLITITTIIVTYPVVAALVKFIWVRGLPNRYQVISYLFAAVAVYFAAKGAAAASIH
jgi:hypothetical protein